MVQWFDFCVRALSVYAVTPGLLGKVFASFHRINLWDWEDAVEDSYQPGSQSPAQPPTTYEPVKTVLFRVRDLHRDLCRLIKPLEHQGADGRFEYLRDRMLELQRQRIGVIDLYFQCLDRNVLDTWLQYIPIGDVSERLQNVQHANENADHLWRMITEIHRELSWFYRRIARETAHDGVASLFGDLAERTEREAAQLSWQMRDE